MSGSATTRITAQLSQVPVIVTAGALLIAIFIGAVGTAVVQLRKDAVADERRDIANLATILSEQTNRSVQSIDLLLQDLQGWISKNQADAADRFRDTVSGEKFRQELRDKIARVQHADAFAVVDADGNVLNSSRPKPNTGFNVSDREYFQYLSSSGDKTLFVGSPVENRATLEWTIFAGRRVSASDGTFLGIVLAAIAIRHFEDIYASIDLPHRESFILARRDGTVLVRHPDPRRRAGQQIPPSSPWHNVVSQGGGFYDSPGYFDGVKRMVAVRPLRDYPLVVDAAVPTEAALATWTRQATYLTVGSAIICAYAVLLMSVTRRQFNRLKRSRGEMRAILETMDQGLLLVAPDDILSHCNARARQILDLPDSLVRSRPKFHDVLKYQWETNQSGRSEGSFEEFCRKRLVVDHPHNQEITRPDGRVIEVRSVPMQHGGFVRTYTDISTRKNAEARIEYLAHHDDLTHLVNRVAFRERMQRAFEMSRAAGRGVAVLCIDLDGFKQVNDTRGHSVGDRVLTEAAERMGSTARAIDTVARLGGDEFAVVMPFTEDAASAAHLANRLIARLGEPYSIDGEEASIGASIGIAIFPQDGASVDDLVKHADEALYEAKRAGRKTYRFHTTDHTHRSVAST